MIPYTLNTPEVRIFLESKGFRPLRFFQGKKFIRPIISNWANKDHQWKEHEYCTFKESEIVHMDYLTQELSFTEFSEKVEKILNV